MDCKRVTVIRIGPVISTKKALYFVGSTVLFFFVPAKRSGVHRSPCRRASDTPDLNRNRYLI